MNAKRSAKVKGSVLVALCVGALGAFAAPANAGLLVASAPNCNHTALSQPFLRWLDPLRYELAPNGGLENGTAGWKLSGAASVVPGNEPFNVAGPSDSSSLRIRSGSSVTSPTVCVGLEAPIMRFFARNAGSPLSILRVEALVESRAGKTIALPIGVVVGLGGWQPSLPMPILGNLLPLLPGQQTPVAFRFTPLGLGGDWRVDDVYVDPYRRS